MADPSDRRAPRPGDSLRTALWLALVPVVTLVVLPFLLLEIGPAYQARFGGGTPGTFVATDVECDDGACRWVGDFVADEGGRLSGVRLIGGDEVSGVGDSVPAVATGSAGAVYPAGGGSNWLVITALLAVVVAALVLWGRALRRHVVARRRPYSEG